MKPRAVVWVERSTGWIVENAETVAESGVVAWMAVVEGAEVIERAKRQCGAEQVVELEDGRDE